MAVNICLGGCWLIGLLACLGSRPACLVAMLQRRAVRLFVVFLLLQVVRAGQGIAVLMVLA